MAQQPPLDRRQANIDRRGHNRQGKYDRRKNLCGLCQFFAQTEKDQECRKHFIHVTQDTFACLQFEPAGKN